MNEPETITVTLRRDDAAVVCYGPFHAATNGITGSPMRLRRALLAALEAPEDPADFNVGPKIPDNGRGAV